MFARIDDVINHNDIFAGNITITFMISATTFLLTAFVE
jgi:hypothetical protein